MSHLQLRDLGDGDGGPQADALPDCDADLNVAENQNLKEGR